MLKAKLKELEMKLADGTAALPKNEQPNEFAQLQHHPPSADYSVYLPPSAQNQGQGSIHLFPSPSSFVSPQILNLPSTSLCPHQQQLSLHSSMKPPSKFGQKNFCEQGENVSGAANLGSNKKEPIFKQKKEELKPESYLKGYSSEKEETDY